MNNSLNQPAPVTQQSSGFFVGILTWMARLVQLTEEEQRDAGIYLGR